ncbi:MAG: imidazole glycerol phosphate synthase subunit HisH [Epsilonproteobacteria bacterium]|nr:imidazole glycerol phosphate synthase subunit HisH [Campylobacterota bacterium]
MITIIDYGMGNATSVKKAYDFLGIKSVITNAPQMVKEGDKILIPGVGAFGDAVDALHELNLFETIKDEVINRKKPILGICLGMQLLAKSSQETKEKEGFGFIDTVCHKFDIDLKVPHVGWNSIKILHANSPLFHTIPDDSDFYFVHSYHFDSKTKEKSTMVNYGYDFTSSVESDNIFGVQFHPEKSQKHGLALLKNFGNL